MDNTEDPRARLADRAEKPKEREKEKRDLSPAPPIERKAKGKERPPTHTTRARACEDVRLPPVIDIHTPPSQELLLAWAAHRHYADTAYILQWYDLMANELFWCHPVTGEPLKHWPAYLRVCYANRHRPHGRPSRFNAQLPVNRLAASDEFERSFCDDLV